MLDTIDNCSVEDLPKSERNRELEERFQAGLLPAKQANLFLLYQSQLLKCGLKTRRDKRNEAYI